MRRFVWILVLLLIVLHQDIWYWTDSTLVFGIIPIGLFYHACISIAAAVTWYLAVQFAWPSTLEQGPATPSQDVINAEGQGNA